MPSETTSVSDAAEPVATPETTALMLSIFSEFYRQEQGAEEDVHRTLPFFGTALGIVIAALAYAAGRLPKWPDLTTERGMIAFAASGILVGLAILEAGCVLVWVSFAIARRGYQRVGPEAALRTRLTELLAYYDQQGIAPTRQDAELAKDMRQVLLDSYAAVTPVNRELNRRRYRFRALAASHLVRSLIRALGAITLIFMADKLGYLPKAAP
jgi:hypothetical protein